MKDAKNIQAFLRDQARQARERAETARTPALREYYLGRADGLQAAANSLSRLAHDPSTNHYLSHD